MKRTVNISTDISSISFTPTTNYEFIFKELNFIGLLVESPTETKTYYLSAEGEEKLTDDILKPALRAFAEIDFQNFDRVANIFLYNHRALVQEVVKEKIEQFSNSITAMSMKY